MFKNVLNEEKNVLDEENSRLDASQDLSSLCDV